MLDGAILEDTDAAAMPKGFSINGSTPYFPKDIKGQPIYSLSSSASQSHYGTRVYTTAGEDKYLPSSTNQYVAYGPAYFLKDPTYSSSYTEASSASSVTYQRDLGHVVFYPSGTYTNLDGTTTTKTFGDYFNDDPEGVYFDMFYCNSSDTRFYMIGDTFKKDSNGAWVVDKTDQLLNFEYHAIEHTLSNGNDDNYTNLFGMAVTIAIPVATLVALFDNLQMMFLLTYAGHMCDAAAEKGDYKKVEHIVRIASIGNKVVLSLLVALGFYFGSSSIEAFVNWVPAWFSHGMDIVAGILPALGIAMLSRMIINKGNWGYLLIGFLISAYLGVSTLGVALLGISIAAILFFRESSSDGKSKEAVADDNEF